MRGRIPVGMLLAACMAPAALGDDVSRDAADCVVLMVLRKENARAERALLTAPNQALAKNLATTRMQEMSSPGADLRGFAFGATRACARIGIPTSTR